MGVPLMVTKINKNYLEYTNWGATLKWNSDNYDVVITSPEDRTEVIVYVAAGDTTVTTSTGGDVTYTQVVPITDNIARLDTDSAVEAAKGNKNLLLVGGPAVNRLTAAVLGLEYPAYGEASTVPENAAMLKVVEDAFGGGKVALVVAGWEADNTQAACRVLQLYDKTDYASKLIGAGVKVSGTATPYEVTPLETTA